MLRLCVVQLDFIPQARKHTLWEPAEPRLDRMSGRDAQDRRKLSVAELFTGAPDTYRQVLDIARDAISTRLNEILNDSTADIIVFPEYAIPVACLPVLLKNSAGRAIVAGLGRIRNAEEAVTLEKAGADVAVNDLVERNVSVLVHNNHAAVITKKHQAQDEDITPGTGPIVRDLRLGGRDVRVGVAVCLDYLRCAEEVRGQDAAIVCVPAYTANVKVFQPDAPRDHVRLFANCALYGGSAIMAPGLPNGGLTDNLGVRPVAAGHEAVVLIEFDQFQTRPARFRTPKNRLVLRSEVIERDSEVHRLLGRLEAILNRQGESTGSAVPQLASDARQSGGARGPFAEGLDELRMSMQQDVNDTDLNRLAQTHLVVMKGNRPAGIRERQAAYVWEQLKLLEQRDPDRPLGSALDLYRPHGGAKPLALDRSEYINGFLRRVPAGPELPELVQRYALSRQHLNLSDDELRNWVTDIVSLWRRQADHGLQNTAETCRRFLAADAEMRQQVRYDDAGWWRAQIRDAGPARSGASPASAADATHGSPAPRLASAGGTRQRSPRQQPPRTQPPRQQPPRQQPPRTQPPGASAADPSSSADLTPTVRRSRPHLRPGQATSSASESTSDPGERTSPPPPVGQVTPRQLDDRVVIEWKLTEVASGDLSFTVERLPTPGIERRQWTTRAGAIEDVEPPAGQPLVYRLRGRKPDSPVRYEAETSVVFTPPVAGLVAHQVADGGVIGWWRMGSSNLHQTVVTRTRAGTSAGPESQTLVQSAADGFNDESPPPGRYVYSVMPIYQDPENLTTHHGPDSSIEVEVVHRPPPPRVELNQTSQPGASAISLQWDELPHEAMLLLRRAVAEPTGAAGDSLILEEAADIGEPVAGAEGLSGTTASITMPAGHWILIPFAVAGHLAVRGESITVDVLPAVTQLEANRNGLDVLVSWHWPEGLRMARVIWRTGGVESIREVTFNEFQRRGGVPFKDSAAAEVQVSGMIRSGDDVLFATPAVTPVPAQTPTLTYHAHRVWPWQVHNMRPYRLHGPRWWCARRRVALEVDLPCRGVTVDLYVRMPSGDPDSIVPITTMTDLALTPDRPYEVMLELPDLSAMGRPRYLSCRAETSSDPIRVDDFASTGREIRPCFR